MVTLQQRCSILGTRGPKAKPRALRILEGNPGRLPVPPDELAVESDLPAIMPDIVANNPRAAAEWGRVIAAMPPGLYSALDVAALSSYALAWSLLHEAQMQLEQNGPTVWTKDGVKTNPALAMWTQATTTLLKCADRLGLNPGARARLEMPAAKETQKSKFAGLLGKT